MATDALDGFIARRFHYESALGKILDPLMDKLFVLFALMLFIRTNQISWPEAATFLARDVALILFASFLLCKRELARHRIRAIWCGKVSTALQFCFLMALVFHIAIPAAMYSIFALLGILALAELYFIDYYRQQRLTHDHRHS
jgi:phosphatidylglycerophosphate synthase